MLKREACVWMTWNHILNFRFMLCYYLAPNRVVIQKLAVPQRPYDQKELSAGDDTKLYKLKFLLSDMLRTMGA